MSFGKEWFKVSLSPNIFIFRFERWTHLVLKVDSFFLSFCSILKLSRQWRSSSKLTIRGSCAHTSLLALSSWRISYNVFWSHSPPPTTLLGHSYLPPCVSLVATFCFFFVSKDLELLFWFFWLWCSLSILLEVCLFSVSPGFPPSTLGRHYEETSVPFISYLLQGKQ